MLDSANPGGGSAVRDVTRRRGTILQPRQALLPVAPKPLEAGARAYACGFSGLRGIPALLDALDQEQAGLRCRLGASMQLHSVSPGLGTGGTAPMIPERSG